VSALGLAFVTFKGASTDATQVWFNTTEAIPRTGDTDTTLDLYELTATGNRPLRTR